MLLYLIGLDDPVENWALWVSWLGIGTFVVGYLFPPARFNNRIPSWVMDVCGTIAYRATLWLAAPALVLALQFFIYRSGVEYGQGEGLSLLHQTVFYGHMFFGFLFLGAARSVSEDRWRIAVVSAMVIAPRLIVSLHWGRFFVAQAVVPVLLIALARGWVTTSRKRILHLSVVVLFIVFVPALVRGDNFSGQDEVVTFFQAGSSLLRLQENRDLNLTGLCPPLLVSLTAKLIPYGLLGVCTMNLQDSEGVPATLDRILTGDEPGTAGTLMGTGSNYLLELYLTGGIGAVLLGSLLFGFTSRCFIQWIGGRSLFAGIWAECLSRALFAPRSTLGYTYERIPTLVVMTLSIAGTVWLLCSSVGASLQNADKTESAWCVLTDPA